MTPESIRTWWWQRQGLGGQLAGRSAQEVLQHSGWSRSVGGCNPYLALFARAGLSREAVDAAVAGLEIHELPSARGCTYVVPASDFALALRAGQGRSDDAEIESAKKHCGVTDKELDRLSQDVLDALGRGPLDPAGLKQALGDSVRHLGAEGKKRGLTTTLPLILGRLQAQGQLRRIPVNGRLDQQRYRYCRWQPSPLSGPRLSDEEVAVELARRFFRWAGPATVKQLAWWAGLSAKAAKAAAAALGLVPLSQSREQLILPEDLDGLRALVVPREPEFALVGSLDNLSHLRREVAGLADEGDLAAVAQREREVPVQWDLPHHAILDRGRLIGYWEYDGAARIVWSSFGSAPAGLAEAVSRTEAFVRDQLGDARSFSLDSPESRVERLDSLRRIAA